MIASAEDEYASLDAAPVPWTKAQIESDLLRPLAQRWTSRIQKAIEKRKPWERRAAECLMFYRCAADPIWDGVPEQEIGRLWPDSQPKFKFVLGKAFELVAVFGPSLFYTVPHRRVTPRTMPEGMQGVLNDAIGPQIQQMQAQGMPPQTHPAVQAYEEDARRFRLQKVTAGLMESWLNYTPSEQPGTLAVHGKLATVDALITGRGVLFARPYRKPNGRVVTGLFREDPLRLVVDPDRKNYQEAGWIALKRIERTRDVEDKFGLPPGSLKKKATLDSAWRSGGDEGTSTYDVDPCDKDLFVYYEVFSKQGVGLDSPEDRPAADPRLAETLTSAVGRYAYLAIAPNCDYPLNARAELFTGTETTAPADEATVAQWFAWPFECWRDDRFPCEVLDFYPDPEMPYPIAPLTPAMGELKYMTLFMSRLASRIWQTSKTVVGVQAAYYDETLKKLQSGEDLAVLRVNSGQQSVQNNVSYLQMPEVNFDAWKILDAVDANFEDRTGMNEGMYGGNAGGTQSRTAEDAAAKREATMIRPQYMQQTTEEFMSRAAGLEAQAARRFVTGDQLVPLLGRTGAMLWDQHVATADVDTIAGEYEYQVDAGSMRRPNKEQNIANIGQAMQQFLGIYSGYAQATGNVAPFNALLRFWGDAVDMDVSELELPPPPPPQPMPPQGPPPGPPGAPPQAGPPRPPMPQPVPQGPPV